MNTLSQTAYPLTSRGLVIGVLAGGLSAVIVSPLAGLSIFVLCAAVSLTWRRNEVPILSFILAAQWVSVSIGLWYEHWVGPLPYAYPPGELDLTVRLALLGLMTLAIGMRIGAGGGRTTADEAWVPSDRAVAILFWIVVATYAVDYVYLLNPRRYFGAASLIDKGLQFRHVLLMALWAAVLAGSGRLRYLVVSFVWVLIPSFGGYFSEFRTPVFLLLLAVTAQWRPWDAEWWRRHTGRVLALVPVVAVALGLAVLWQGAVKQEAREAQDEGFVGASPLERVEFFVDSVQTNLPAIVDDAGAAIGDLVGRLSYVSFFSRVLEHTPSVEPYADGELLWMAVVNGTVPRFLFRDKPELPSDSFYTRRFAGIRVAESADGNTSISIGYMAEFYADWGTNGMFLSVLAYGIWTGLLHRGVRRLVRMSALRHGALVVVLIPTLMFEHQFVKGFGALNIGFLVTVLLAAVAGPILLQILGVEGRGSVRPTLWSSPSGPETSASKP